MTPDPFERLYAVACGALFVFGIVLGLPGTVLGLPEVVERFGLTLSERGELISALFFGLLIGSVVSGPVVDTLGQRAALAGSSALVALCLPLFAVASSALLAATALAALGLAAAGMNTAANALSSDLFPEQRARRMNGIAIAVGAGGLAMPLVTALTAGSVSWQGGVLIGAAIAAIMAIVGARLELPPSPRTAAGLTLAAFSHFLRQRGFVWFCVLLMLGGGNEASMAGWTSTYLSASSFTPETATWVLSSHWLGLIVGRVAFFRRVDRAKKRSIVRAAFGGAAALALFVTAGGLLLAVMPFVVGVAIAVIVPTSLAFAGERYPGNAGTLFAILLTLAQVGGMTLPAAIGIIADQTTIRVGLSLLIASTLAVAYVTSRAGRS